MTKLDPRLRAAIDQVTAKRPRTVIEHILKHGAITTQELKEQYGYNHPPRAARDVREAGIPLETFKVAGTDGRKIAAYRFGDPGAIEGHKLAGRRTFSKELKNQLTEVAGSRCAICQTKYEGRYLQIDHRVPYEVSSDSSELAPSKLMLLCGSCQRSKSWTCEHCSNWIGAKNYDECSTCYWASPEEYSHAAGRPERRLDVSWVAEEVPVYEALKAEADSRELSVTEFLKRIVAEELSEGDPS